MGADTSARYAKTRVQNGGPLNVFARRERTRSGNRVQSVFVDAPAKGTQGRGDGEELLECHVQILEAALMVDPAVIIEDFVGNHKRNYRQAVRYRELAGSSGKSRLNWLLRNWLLRIRRRSL